MRPYIIALFCVLGFKDTLSQVPSDEKERRDGRWEIRYQQIRDSLALLYPSVPAVNSILIREKQLEANFYNSLLSANRFRDNDGELKDYNFRQTYLYTTLQLNYGVSKNERVNLGVGLQALTGRIDQDRNSSIFKVFDSDVDGNSLYASALTSVVIPRVRWRPFRNNYKFTIQSSIGLPISVSTEKQQVLGRGQVYFLNQFIYNHPLSSRFFLLSQLSVQHNFKRTNVPGVWYTPVSVYLSHFIPRKTVFFALMNYVPVFLKGSDRFTFQGGGGVQYQVSRHLLVNGFYANDLFGKNYPDFDSYTIGLRLVYP